MGSNDTSPRTDTFPSLIQKYNQSLVIFKLLKMLVCQEYRTFVIMAILGWHINSRTLDKTLNFYQGVIVFRTIKSNF